MELELSYPYYFLSICLVIGLAYSLGLYFRSKKKSKLPSKFIYLLFAFRFIIVSALCAVLLEPMFKTVDESKERPIVVFAQDDSESILLSKDSSFYINAYKDSIEVLSNQIASKYEVDFLKFGSSVNSDKLISYTDKKTNLDQLLTEIKNRYYGRNLASIIISSDGLFNSGYHPLYKEYGLDNVSIHSISLGDSTVRKDLSIQKIRHNKDVVLGNSFPVEISLLSNNFQNNEFMLSISLNSEVIHQQNIQPKLEIESFKIPIVLEANKIGLSKYRVDIQRKKGEITYQNNSSTFYVNVVDETQQVLLLAKSPHPDVSALKSALSNKIGRSINVRLLSDFDGDFSNYDLVITHRLTSQITTSISNYFKTIRKANIPVLNITGSTMAVNYGDLNLGIEMNDLKGSYAVTALVDENFNNFIVPQQMIKQLEDYPPLDVPFSSNYKTTFQGSTVLFQKINGVETTYPLLQFSQLENYKIGTLLGEGIWRWRMNELMKSEKSDIFDSFLSKIIQYLLSTEKKEKFTIDVSQEFIENEPVQFFSKLYNENYELVDNVDVKLELFNDTSKVLEKLFNSSSNGYFLNINQLFPGNYSYKVSTQMGDKSYFKKGDFVVKQMKLEYLKTKADIHFLNLLSSKYNGNLYSPYSTGKLADDLLKNQQVADLINYDIKFEDIIKRKLLFVLFIVLLSGEWLLRKLLGSY